METHRDRRHGPLTERRRQRDGQGNARVHKDRSVENLGPGGGGLHWIAGQDPASLGRLSDGIIPMAFTRILGQTPGWKKELLDHVAAESGKEVMSYVQFEALIRPTTITGEQLQQEIAAAIATAPG